MKKLIIMLSLIAFIPFTVAAQANNIGSCGWGSKLFQGQKGIAPQVLAVTTNGTSGNQTFAISSGTSGCTQNGVVTSSWKTAAYLDGNMTKFARDASRGNGETIDTLANLLQVRAEHRQIFAQTLKNNFRTIFASDSASSTEVLAALKTVLGSDETLRGYSVNI
jgi:hypothetical protein